MANTIMDPQKIEEFRGYGDGTDSFIIELFQQYFESSTDLMKKIAESHKNNDMKQLLSNVHTLKGSTRNMGLLEFGDFIIEWEKRLKEGNLNTFNADYQTAEKMYNTVKKYQEENFPY